MEQGEYQKEEIDWSYVEFVDNQDVVDLIEKVCFIHLSVIFVNSCCVFFFFFLKCFASIFCRSQVVLLPF